ncbi:MAG: ABC transporter ATP-binding protein [Gemmatimonadetes bacterium]|nr:ABC transporter ATP-binding protein [Gemmatimonadota bacterium]
MNESKVQEPDVTVSNLTKLYGNRPAVQNVSFQLGKGVTALLGPNGAGKSTIIRCISGLIDWNEGDIAVGGVNCRLDPQLARSKIGYLPERAAFPNDLRVTTYLEYAAHMKKVPRAERADAVDVALDHLDLKPVAKRLVGNLSKGYRQRVGLAQALVGRPPVLVLDEPLAGIDPLHIWDFRDVLTGYASEHTILLSTHMIPEARILCDRVLVVSEGLLVYDGSLIGAELSGRVARRWRIGVLGPTLDELRRQVESVGASIVYQAGSDTSNNLVIDAEDPQSVRALVQATIAQGWSVAHLEPLTDLIGAAFERAGITQAAPSPE